MIFLSIADTLSDASELDRCLSEIAQGSAQALDELYKKTKTAVFAYSLSLLKNFHDAEDVAQDVFVTVYINAPAYSSVGKPMAWINAPTIWTATRRNAFLPNTPYRRKQSPKTSFL